MGWGSDGVACRRSAGRDRVHHRDRRSAAAPNGALLGPNAWIALIWWSSWLSCAGQLALADLEVEGTNTLRLGNLASEFRIRSWTTEDNLPQNTINCLYQASDGYLWIGTRQGLARYDGAKFVSYDLRNTPALPNPDIQALAENPPGTLWIGTRNGLCRYAHHTFTSVPLPPGDCYVRSLCSRRSGGVWLGTAAGPMWIEHDTPFICPNYPGIGDGRSVFIHAVLEDSKGDLWLRDDRGVVRLRRGETGFEIVHAPDPKGIVNTCNGAGLIEDSAGGVWFGWSIGLCHWRDGRVEYYPRDGAGSTRHGFRGEPAVLARDRRGGIWIADGWGGLSRWLNDQVTHYRAPTGLSDEYITCLLPDREGNLWVGTRHGGLNRLQPRRFTSLTTADGLPDDNVWSVSAAPDGSVWIATGHGLSQWINGRFVNRFVAHVDPFTQDRLNGFGSVVADSLGRVWAGSGAGLTQIQSNHVVPVCLSRGGTNYPIPAQTLYVDRTGALWAGGPDLFREKDGVWEVFVPRAETVPAEAHPVLPDPNVVGVLQDASGAFWIGTKTGGMARLRGAQCDWFGPTNGFPARYAAAALADSDGTVWFASDRGLIRGQDDRFFLFTTEHGLSEDLVLNVLEDDLGWLWLNGHRGLQRVRKADLNEVVQGRTNRVRSFHYGEADGMLSAEGNGRALPNSCRTRDGRLWFPTTKGVVVVDPHALEHNQVPPPVVLEQVVADGEIIYGERPNPPSPGARPAAAGAEFPQAEWRLAAGRARSLIFRYTANSLVAPDQVRFRYRLEGHDADWREDNANLRTAFYTNLRPGAYRFRVTAFNNHGVPSARDAEFAFRLAPHYYETWPFKGLCAVTVLGLGTILHSTRLRGLRRIEELERQHALDLERARIARDLHDDLGADLTKMALLADLAQRAPSPGALSSRQLERVAALARGLVDSIGELVWATNPLHDRLDGLAAFLREYAADLPGAEGLRYHFDFPREIPPRAISGPVRRQLFLCAKEALNNVVKHAQASEVTLRLVVTEHHVEITIADNGRGLASGSGHPADPDPPPFGNGLRNLRQRIHSIGGACQIESAPGRGTRVSLRVPLDAKVEELENG